MKITNTKSTAAALILAASAIPAFAQFRGHGSDRGFERSGRPQFEQQRSFQAPTAPRFQQRGDSFRERSTPQFEQRSQPQYQQRQFSPPQPAYRQQNNWQQPAYRSEGRQFGGNAFRGDNGARYQSSSRGYGFGGSGHYVIPQNRFYSSFGRNHFFRIGRPVFYGRYPRFQYGGFWFSFGSAVPAYWGQNWYDDDVYIDYSDGGYSLYDNRYPGQGVPLEVDNGDGYGAPPDGSYGAPPEGTYGNPNGGYGAPYGGPSGPPYGNGYGGSYPYPN